MPSFLHEVLVQTLLNRPRLASEMLLALGEEALLPQSHVSRMGSADLTEVRPAELRADALVELEGPGGKLVVIVEVQLGKDEEKAFSWPHYLLAARKRHGSPVVLVVVTPRADIAGWARPRLPRFLPGSELRAFLFGPEEIPRITDPARARESPELALLSLLAAQDDDVATALRVAQAAELAFRDLPEDQGSLYFDAGRREMADAVRLALEENMGPGRKYEYQSDFARRYVAEGRAEGREEGQRLLLSRLFGARFGPLPAWAMTRLDSADGAELERFSERLLSAATLEDALGPEQSNE